MSNALAEQRNALRDIMANSLPQGIGELRISDALDSLNRGMVAGTLGAPVDLGNTIAGAFGYGQDVPAGGSEWIGQKMQDMGMVTKRRDPVAEFVASLADPLSTFTGALKAGATMGKSIPIVAGIFAGKGAKMADMANLQQAEKMLDAGEDAASVWKVTGWGKGPDGRWRFEIPDDAADLSEYLKSGAVTSWGLDEGINAAETMKHDPLYLNYNDVGEIPTSGRIRSGITDLADSTMGFGNSARGGFSEKGISLNTPIDETKSTMLHELQHAIQEREGFAKGGSPSNLNAKDILPDEFATLSGKVKKDKTDPFGRFTYISNSGTARRISNDEAIKWYGSQFGINPEVEIYRRLAGEAEARLTQSRMNMNALQRAEQYPWEPEYFQQATGVPVDRLIYRYDGNGPANSIDLDYISPDNAKVLLEGKTEKPRGVNPSDFIRSENDYGSGRVPLSMIEENQNGLLYDGTVDKDRAVEYANRTGGFPPVILSAGRDGKTLYVVDGGHRVTAARMRGDSDISAVVGNTKRSNLLKVR